MKILFVHIGTPKTGTTAIQEFCWHNRPVLEKYGYVYPDLSWLCPGFMVRRNGHFLIGEKGSANPVFRQGMEKIDELFLEYDRIILSDEGIWKASGGSHKNLWKELKKEGKKGGYQVKVLMYLRRQDDFLSSSWNQIVKLGREKNAVKSWDEYTANIPNERERMLDYERNIRSAEAVLGKENVIVRCYESRRFHGGIIQSDFLDAVGMTMTEEFELNTEVTNTSLTGNMHEIKRILNRVEAFGERENQFFIDVLKNCSMEPDTRWDFRMFSKEETEKFLKKYEEGNRRIAEEYLGETEAGLFDPGILDVPKWEKGNPHMEDDMIRFVGMSCMALLEENEKLRQRQDVLNDQLNRLNDQLKRLKWQIRHPFRALWEMFRKK